MTWVRSDDQDAFATAIVAAGNAAVGALYRMRCWSSAQLTDGIVPRAIARSIGTARELAAAVSAGLLVDRGDSYEIVGHMVLNPSREQVLADREARRASARTAARARWGSADAPTDAASMPPACDDASPPHLRVDAPVPSRPVPTDLPLALSGEPPAPTSHQARQKPRTAAPDTTDASALDAFCARWKLDARDPEVLHMLDHHRGKGSLFADWAAAWRTWRANAPAFARPHRNGALHVQPAPPVRDWEPGDPGAPS